MRQLAQSEACTHMCISRATVRKRYSDFEHGMKKSKQCGIAGFCITPSAGTSRWQCSNFAADDCDDDVQLAFMDPVQPEHEAPLEPAQTRSQPEPGADGDADGDADCDSDGDATRTKSTTTSTSTSVDDNEDGRPADKRRRTGKVVARAPSRQGFTPAWLTKFDWLLYDKTDDSMACRLCRLSPAARRQRVDARHTEFSRQEFGAARL